MKRNHYPDATWERVRQDFCSGELTLAEAAAKHGVNFKAAESRERREGWRMSLQENLKVVKEIAGTALQRQSANLGERAAEFLGESSELLQTLLADLKNKRGATPTLADVERIVDAFSTLTKSGRELYGLDQQRDSRMCNRLVLVSTSAQPCVRSSAPPVIDVESTSDATPTPTGGKR